MSATSPAQLSYDVFVSDGPARAGDEHMPDGAPGMIARQGQDRLTPESRQPRI